MKSNKPKSVKSNKPSKLELEKLTLRRLSESEQVKIVGGMASTGEDDFSCVWPDGCIPL